MHNFITAVAYHLNNAWANSDGYGDTTLGPTKSKLHILYVWPIKLPIQTVCQLYIGLDKVLSYNSFITLTDRRIIHVNIVNELKCGQCVS